MSSNQTQEGLIKHQPKKKEIQNVQNFIRSITKNDSKPIKVRSPSVSEMPDTKAGKLIDLQVREIKMKLHKQDVVHHKSYLNTGCIMVL